MLSKRGHLVFWFNPWAARSLDELWGDFVNRMYDALKAHGIPVESRVHETARKSFWFFRKNPTPVQAIADQIHFGKAAYAIGMRMMQSWLDPRGPQLARIREHLKEKRLVVIVDDLDRADPKVVPQLLLALRELMDLPGFPVGQFVRVEEGALCRFNRHRHEPQE